MTEFRIFSITVFVAGGALAAVDNHGIAPVSNFAWIVLTAFAGFAAVAFFGRRDAQ